MEALLIDYLLNRSSELKTQPMVYYISRAELVLCVELANNGDKDGKLLINELLKENPHPSRVGLFTFRFFEGISTSFVFVCVYRGGGGGGAPSRPGLSLDGSPVPLGSAAAHEPALVLESAWARWKTLGMNKHQISK